MQFAAGTCGSDSLGSIMVDPGAIVDPTSLRPILTEINGVDARYCIAMDTLTIQDTLGQPVTASFMMVNQPPNTAQAPQDFIVPTVGDTVRILYHSQVIFAGTMDHVTKNSTDLVTFQYQVDCLDWSQTLMRRKLRRNFINAPIQNILDSILDNELVNELLTIGTIDSRATMPLVDSQNAKVFDVLRDTAGATGQTFYVEFDQSIQMRSTSVSAAPLVFSEVNVLLDGMASTVDRETYRNVQTVIVTGTPQVDNQDALITVQQRTNDDQIAARIAIEGGAGIYEEIEEVTHPTSNDGVEIALLGISYARLRLASSGTPRVTVRCRVRGYGFRGGQVATVNLPTFGIIGTYIVQRVSIKESAGRDLFHDLELTSSSLQQRAYESWLGIVKAGKVTVQVPGSLTNNTQSFNTPGSTTWTVPAGVTVAEFTCYGGSGGGGGGVLAYYVAGSGGNSGKAITSMDVIEGQIFDLVIGAAGSAGTNETNAVFDDGTDGTDGTASSVSLSGVISCQGDAGLKGTRARANYTPPYYGANGVDGATGSGIGDAVSTGGGRTGGTRGTGTGPAGGAYAGPQPTAGSDGLVEVRW